MPCLAKYPVLLKIQNISNYLKLGLPIVNPSFYLLEGNRKEKFPHELFS